MNKYIVAIYRYFRGYENFTIEAKNKESAVKELKEYIKAHGSGNYKIDDIKVIKKLKK